jgi:hypothetical protein
VAAIVKFDSLTLFQDEEAGDTRLAVYVSFDGVEVLRWNNGGAKVDEVNTYSLSSGGSQPTRALIVSAQTTIGVIGWTDDDEPWPSQQTSENTLGTASLAIDPTDPNAFGTKTLGPTQTDGGNRGFQITFTVAPAPSTLDGVWASDDWGMYFIRQSGNQVWWAGLSIESPGGAADFQLGVRYANVFRGTLQGNTITGAWADVPRGGSLNLGTLTLTVAADGSIGRVAETGGFGGTTFRRAVLSPQADARTRFNAVMRNDGGTMTDHLKLYRDNTLVFAKLLDDSHVNFPPDIQRTYQEFLDADGRYDVDGDYDFRMAIDRANLENQSGFWTNGWVNPPGDIREKLDDQNDNSMASELIMYGRPSDAAKFPALLPGWMEQGAQSILINGRPVNGNVAIGVPASLGNYSLSQPMEVRVTGALVLDCHGGDCGDGDPTNHNVEIHPVYSVDVLQRFELGGRGKADLTGAWHGPDLGTYYVRQFGEAVWWLALSVDRGQTFAHVFHGSLRGSVLTGDWVDVPLGTATGSGSLTLNATDGRNPAGPLATYLSAQTVIWRKLYDVIPPWR